MLLNRGSDNNVIKEIHCPYCKSEEAVLMSRTTAQKTSIQFPAYGLKFLLSFIYLSIVHVLTNGFKLLETIKKYDNITYVFCPHCGNSYSMAPPEVVKEENEAPKLYKIRDGKVIMGLCKGISEFTGISLFWIRIMTVLYGVTIIGALIYFLVGACISFKDETHEEITNKKFYRISKGKDIMGLCKGFSVYTGIPVAWVRLFMLIFGATVVGIAIYFIVSIFVPVKEDVENGIIKKKLYKVKAGKWIFGLCEGFVIYSGAPIWLVRIIAVLITPIYLLLAAFVPTEEDLNE